MTNHYKAILWPTFLAVLLLLPGLTDADIGGKSYRLSAGDRIMIRVMGEDDLTIETLVGDSGMISYPFLGEIRVKGMTPFSLEQHITSHLRGPYLVDPEVTISILEYRQFFVNGHVNSPGGYSFQPGITVRKAVSIAGGFGKRANKKKIFVVHEDDPKSDQVAVSLDEPVRPGDIITVERSFF